MISRCVALVLASALPHDDVHQDWKSILDVTKEALFTALAQRNVCERAGIILNKVVTGLDVRTARALLKRFGGYVFDAGCLALLRPIRFF